ncbi:hypothetical protein C8A00DRAFT_12279 [Chaetomidium leptoderma]|uniref:Pyridoxamine 5'-phosphate oxidase Alr4036 family FMN-binding domain-containing protein n=1 Tax=Chaetomidium leptoderma TaxID=669021 RepID=A0AAN6VUR4_9PEZI|nr:hypothetical protein C8A00DRAFT_12279 [Chaetomidium leptoderma]
MPTAAPWRAPFLTHLSHLPTTPTFTLATLHPAPQSESPSAALPCLPRARTCVFRGLWAAPFPTTRSPSSSSSSGSHQPQLQLNPPLFESDLPVFTTDARTDKATEIFDSAAAGDVEASGGATGGGGPVEAVFWVDVNNNNNNKAGVVRTQWRVRGHAWVLAGGDVDSLEGEGPRRARGVLRGRMRKVRGQDGEEEEEGWSFAKEVAAHFGHLTPLMRGSFRGPPPGTPVAYHTEKGEGVGQRLDDLEDEVARRNFRVVVIVPDEVDQVDLSDELRPRRWLYVYRGVGGVSKLPGGEIIGEWEKVEVWP